MDRVKNHFTSLTVTLLRRIEWRTRRREIIVFGSAVLILFLLFLVVPLPGGDDWGIYHGAVQRLLNGDTFYGEKITFSYFYNPPWLALVLIPAGLLPFKAGWALLSITSLLVIFEMVRRWQMGIVRLIALLLSPPMIYILLHGQIDALVMGFALLPREWWLLAALTKPQVSIGLIFGTLRARWLKMAIITISTVGLTFLLFGNWLPAYLSQPTQFIDQGHNVWSGLWPFQVPLGIALSLLGMERNDRRMLLAASPFFSPYAATSALLGPWMLLVSRLKNWQAAIVFAAWWGAVIYRTFV